jgi:hypothetical protein
MINTIPVPVLFSPAAGYPNQGASGVDRPLPPSCLLQAVQPYLQIKHMQNGFSEVSEPDPNGLDIAVRFRRKYYNKTHFYKYLGGKIACLVTSSS